MEKIPTLFVRDDKFRLTDEIYEGCAWVFSPGVAMATEKLDGMNMRLTIRSGTVVRLEKRRNPDKAQKHYGIREPW